MDPVLGVLPGKSKLFVHFPSDSWEKSHWEKGPRKRAFFVGKAGK